MIDAFTHIISQFFEKSGFFFVPVLGLFGLLHLKSLKPGLGKILFSAGTSVFLAVYLLLGTDSSRYVLIPLLTWGLLAGAGLEFCCTWLLKIPFLKRIPLHVFLLCTAAVICGICIMRVALHGQNEDVFLFSKCILEDKKEDSVVYSVNFRDTSKLRGVFSGIPELEVLDFEIMDSAIRHFINHQYEKKTFYFCTEMPRNYTSSDFKSWFRSCYNVYPFDLLQDYCYRKKRYLLLKFNRRTLARAHETPERSVFCCENKPLQIQKWKEPWYFFSLSDVLSSGLPQRNGFFTSDIARKIGPYFYARGNIDISLSSPVQITFYNDLFWPEEQRFFPVSVSGEADAAPKLPDVEIPEFERPALVSQESPLMLIPPCIMVPETFPEIYLSGAIPVYRSESSNIVFPNQEMIPVKKGDRTVSFQFTEQRTGRKISGDIPVQWLEKRELQNQKYSLLLVEASQRLCLLESLSQLFGNQDCIDSISAKNHAATSLDIVEYSGWKKKKYQAILLNILLDPISRPWSFHFQTGRVTDTLLTGFIRKLQEWYPDTPCFIILPPAPTFRPSWYPITPRSPELSRLSHYRVCDAVQRWFVRTKPENVYLIPLYFCVNPEEDYVFNSKIGSLKTYSGYVFKPYVVNRFAELTAFSVLHFLDKPALMHNKK